MIDERSSNLVLVRHGATEHNSSINPVITGSINIELAEAGRQQARHLGAWLAKQGYTFDRALTSSLGRAIETTQLILETLGSQDPARLTRLEAFSELDERRWGVVEGMTFDQAHQDYSEADWAEWYTWHGAPPQGESYAQMDRRMRNFLEYKILFHAAEGENVLVVGHTEMLKVLRRRLERLPESATSTLKMANCDSHLYRIGRSGAVLEHRALY